MLFVKAWHWLDQNLELPPRDQPVYRRALRMARCIEYGGPLLPYQTRETLLECQRRPGRQPCPGMVWVSKAPDRTIHVYCPVCKSPEADISEWEDTLWAEGAMEPVTLYPERN